MNVTDLMHVTNLSTSVDGHKAVEKANDHKTFIDKEWMYLYFLYCVLFLRLKRY